jgi:hypothetical protein
VIQEQLGTLQVGDKVEIESFGERIWRHLYVKLMESHRSCTF